MVYDFVSPSTIVFGWGRRVEVGRLASRIARRAFVVCGSRTLEQSGLPQQFDNLLRQAGVEPIHVPRPASHEPEVSDVDNLTRWLIDRGATDSDCLIAVGGGSTIDLAKAAAALATNSAGVPPSGGSSDRLKPGLQPTSVREFLEGVGSGRTITRPPLPLIAIPTTAGTGSEATKNAVISSYDPPFKKSLRSDLMLPRVVLVDPELTVSVPPHITAWTGMDAITQLIESYVSCRSQPIPRTLAMQGLELAIPAVVEAVRDGSSRSARERMSHAALLSGLSLANSGLGLAHGVAAALGSCAKVPHGLACAVMLRVALRVNRSVCTESFASLAPAITNRTHASTDTAADAVVARIDELCHDLGIPRRLSELGVRPDQIPDLVAGSHGNSLSGNPREISDAELRETLEQMF
ncbi:MAG: iron-containing alcohol dehydrogenase [Planctomycetales bacterium]|nr:iron-containing alcohol dehydrogenase [Planctomycetales bacterium]